MTQRLNRGLLTTLTSITLSSQLGGPERVQLFVFREKRMRILYKYSKNIASQRRPGKFRRYQSQAHAKQDIFRYIEACYNRKRRHSSLGYLSPEAFEKGWQQLPSTA